MGGWGGVGGSRQGWEPSRSGWLWGVMPEAPWRVGSRKYMIHRLHQSPGRQEALSKRGRLGRGPARVQTVGHRQGSPGRGLLQRPWGQRQWQEGKLAGTGSSGEGRRAGPSLPDQCKGTVQAARLCDLEKSQCPLRAKKYLAEPPGLAWPGKHSKLNTQGHGDKHSQGGLAQDSPPLTGPPALFSIAPSWVKSSRLRGAWLAQ